MNHIKVLGLVAIAAMTLMAFAGTASATELYSGATTLGKGTLIKASLEKTSLLLESGGTTLNTCTGGQFTVEVTNPGSSTTTTSGPIKTLDFENCPNEVHIISLGTLEVHHIAGTNDGTLTTSGLQIAETIFGTSCAYASGTGKDLGTLDGVTSGDATIATNIVLSEEAPTKFLCPDTAKLTASFWVTSPTPLHVTAS